ncbi:glycosyltransferase family 1 protein [Rhizophagus clarus]|nr:glycosyltransferase family 1 protein [Rhizophagus clarus]
MFFLLLNQVHVNAVTHNYIPRNVDIDRLPKNILIGSYIGGRSHVKPMLDVAAILMERGHNIILLTSGNYEPSSEYPGLKQITLGPRITPKDIKGLDIHKDVGYERLSKLLEFRVNSYNETYEKYKNVAKEYNIDLFFCDFLANEVCVDVAHSLKKPAVGFTSFLHFIDRKPYKSDPFYGCSSISLENVSFFERFMCTLIQPLKVAYALWYPKRLLDDVKHKMNIEKTLKESPKFSLVLIDNFFGFELPQSLAPNIQDIGPVFSEKYPPLTPELSNFINSHKRVLYVAFGGRFVATTENNNKILQSLVEVINKKLVDGVIWALTVASKDEFYPTLDLTDGTQIQTLPILNNKHPHIHITKFSPQFAVLNHTNTKLFFSHGGTGSVYESLYTGTPMLVLPLAGDQFGNAQRLEKAGVSSSLNKHNLNVNDIINKIDSLLKDEHVKKNLVRMKFLTRINSKRKYRAADLIEYVLHSNSLLDENIDDGFLKEWNSAEFRMGFIKANNLDIYGALIGIILIIIGGITFKLILYATNHSSVEIKFKKA